MRLSNMLRELAVFAATISIVDLGLFLWTDLVLFNPFIALLLLFASPFVYAMGIAAERTERRQ